MHKESLINHLLASQLILDESGVKEGSFVANLGCGSNGYLVFKLAEIVGKHGAVYAVDIIKTNLETIKRQTKLHNLANIKPIWSDLDIAKATKINNNSLDCTLLINTLHQSKDKKTMLTEAARLLKSGGRLVVIDWKKVAAPLGPQPEHKVDKELVISLAKTNSLSLIKEFLPGNYHYGLTFVKI